MTLSDASPKPPAEVVHRLSEILRDGLDHHRVAAAQALGRIGDAACTDPLVHALRDEDEDVRIDAATALGVIGDLAAGEALLDNLVNDPSPEVKKVALDALIACRFQPVVPCLEKLIISRPEDMVWDDEAFFQDGWDDWLDLQLSAIEGVAAFGIESAVPAIVHALQDEEGQDLTEQAVAAFSRLGFSGIEAMKRLLGDGERMRRAIARCLVNAPIEIAGDLIVSLIKDQSAAVRLEVLLTLHKIAPGYADLRSFFEDDDPSVRAEAVTLLGFDYPDDLRLALRDTSIFVAAAALEVVAQHPDLLPPDILMPFLSEWIESDDQTVADPASTLLATIAPKDALALAKENLVSASEPKQFRALKVLVTIADKEPEWPNEAGDVVLQLIENRGDCHPGIIAEALRLLGPHAKPEIVVSLIAAAEDPSDVIREAAYESIAQVLRLQSLVPDYLMKALAKGLADALPTVRLNSVHALGLVNHPETIDLLLSAFSSQENDPTVRAALIDALAKKGEVVEDLEAHLYDDHIGLRLSACKALAGDNRFANTTKILEFACAFDGMHATQVIDFIPSGRVNEAKGALLNYLSDESKTQTWSIVIDMLGRLYAPRPEG